MITAEGVSRSENQLSVDQWISGNADHPRATGLRIEPDQ